MNNLPFPVLRICLLILSLLALSACEKLGFSSKQSNALGNRPDLDCIIANDFYAVHFSAYVQPVPGEHNADPKAAFVPYCQKIPRPGKMFFTADLIDRDIRATPIGIKVIEVEKTGLKAPDDYKEIRTVSEIPAKLYPRGAVEAQAEIDKKGDYLLYLLIGDAIEEDDKFRIPLEVGVDPNAIPVHIIALAAVGILLVVVLVFLLYLYKFKAKKS
ncbi:hypothetical protein KEF85_15620 [Methylomonas paludis]|uniref:Uncharacterized protein n=1 Tax=Methylomonas paludis TaxID=1173101 RepID=A0A975R9Y8_9GAMM|nr:hypothetical protein [Methylomonas paludis]QWF70729.1 hypothetical protein KEF85_15620 [Methylomonas paludis]